MTTQIKITQLVDIGANLATTTVLPVVNMSGVPTTQKTNLGNVGNTILQGAGTTWKPAALANLAYAVANAAQPNITSTGTLSSLTVSGNTNLGAVANVKITGGSDGYVLQTDGTGNLSWTAQTGGSGNASPAGANTQVQFNDAGSFGGNSGFTFNKVAGSLASPMVDTTAVYHLAGTVIENADLTHGATAAVIIPANGNTSNPVQVTNTYGNVVVTTGINSGSLKNWTFDNTGNLILPANTFAVKYANGTQVSIPTVGNIAVANFDGNASNVLHGDGTWSADLTTYGNSNVATFLAAFGSNTITTTGNVNVGNLITSGVASATGNVRGGNLNTAGIVSATGNIQGANLLVGDTTKGIISWDANSMGVVTDVSGDLTGIYLVKNAEAQLYANGNVSLYSDTGNNGYQWKFDTTGGLTIPSGSNTNTNQGQIFSQNENSFINLDVQFGSDVLGGVRLGTSGTKPVDIVTGNGGGGFYTWRFDSNGSTIFPTLNIDLHNGGNQNAQLLQFGDPNQQAVITGPTPPLNNNAQRLIIQGQRGTGGEGGDVYLWGGDSDVNGGDIKIYAGDADTSGYGGYINIDAGSGVNGGGQLTLTSGQSSGGQGGQISITPGYSGDADGALLVLNGGQGAGAGGGVNITAGYGGADGGQVTITGGQSALGLAHYGNVVVNAGASSWTFDNTGILKFPDNTVMGAVEGANTFGFYNANAIDFLIEGPNNVSWSFDTGTGDTVIPGNSTIGTPIATGGAGGNSITIRAGSSDTFASSPGGDLGLFGGYGSFGDGGGPPGGNVVIASGLSSDSHPGNVSINTGSNQWLLDYTGKLTLPTISLGSGVDEQAVVSSQRKLIPPLRYSAVIDGNTPTVVYTATDVNTTSMKVTMQIQHAGLGMEFFEVFATFTGADTYFTVGNRVSPPTIEPSTVAVGLTGSNQMKITITINSGATTSWVTYDAVEFGIAVD